MRRHPKIKDLMDQFICVRLTQCHHIDLKKFQFDYNLTFAIFLMHADGTIYGRYGTRGSHRDSEAFVSLDGLKGTLQKALQLHQEYPRNKTSLSGKTQKSLLSVDSPENYPAMKKKKIVPRDYKGDLGTAAVSCIHCHQIKSSEMQLQWNKRKTLKDTMINELLYSWPMPSAAGLVLNPRTRATVKRIIPSSPADKAGMKPGDDILTLQNQPILSIADIQWILHRTEKSAHLHVRFQRDGEVKESTIDLKEGWRRKEASNNKLWDEYRTSSVNHTLFGRMLLEKLNATARRPLNLSDEQMAFRIVYVWPHGNAEKAGLKTKDILIKFADIKDAKSKLELAERLLRKRISGETLPITILRSGKEVNLNLTLP